MPAVSVCDPLAVAIRHNLDAASQSKSSDDLNLSLAGSASRILRTEIDYEETANYKSTAQDRLKSKCMVLSLPKQENSENGKVKEGAACSKTPDKDKEPRLPEPNVVLYPPDKVNLGWNKKFPISAGMYNVGNTCYLNSTLQALFHVPALVNWLLSDSHHSSKCEQSVRHRHISDGGGECLTCAVAKTLQFSHQKSGYAIKPFYVYNKLKVICRTMVPGQQEDAHEFLRYLLEGMEKAYLARHKALKLDSYSKETTPINQIFGGYIRTEVKCLQCRHVSTTFQHFQDLLLDIRKAGTLDEALAGYFSQEQLDNDYKCEACKRRVPATKQFILERPPKVLCVQLKRFSVLGGKISRHISFKQTVDMSPYIRRKPGDPPSKLTYRLASMVNHMGPSVNCGHYTAIAQVSSGEFYSFDDSCVRPVVLGPVVSSNAYIMIFEMEPSSSLNCQLQSNQVMSTKNDSSVPKNIPSFSNANGFSSKLSDSNGASKLAPTNKSDENGACSTPKNQENSSAASSLPLPPPPPPLTPSTKERRNFIGPQLPPHMEKNRLHEAPKNSKLVDYDGDSSDDDEKSGSSKSLRDEREIAKPSNNSFSSGSSIKTIKTNGNGYSHSPEISRPPSTHNGNGHHSLSNGVDASNGVGSGSGGCSGSGSSPRESSPKNGTSTNGKVEHNNGSSSMDAKWYRPKARSDPPEQKVYTKASMNRGWHVCKDSSSPSSAAPVNGWSVSDNVLDEPNSNGNRFNNQSATPNAAEMRNFNGTNRSDTVVQLQKHSNWGYGNSSNVHSWNGGKARLDREIDNQRRQDRKRMYEDDDDELDRGRTRRIKHHDYKNHEAKYNRFQEHQNNGPKWKHNNHYRSNHNNHPYRRHGNGGNYNRQHHRYHHNKSRNGWHR